MKIRKTLSLIMAAMMAVSVTAWGAEDSSPEETVTEATEGLQTNLEKIDSQAWQYNAEDDVYYQIGISYCENPADAS